MQVALKGVQFDVNVSENMYWMIAFRQSCFNILKTVPVVEVVEVEKSKVELTSENVE